MECWLDRIDLFRVFIHLVDSASFTRTADALRMPRSSVSAAIKELESRVGAQLLNRTTRKVSPTQDGLQLYERSVRLVSDMDEAENIFRIRDGGPSGILRVNVPGRIGRLIIIPALPTFFKQYPGIDLEIGVTDRAVNLMEEGIDCVLRVGEIASSSLIMKSLGNLPLINVASLTYIARYGMPTMPEELKHHVAIRYVSPTSGRAAPWEWREKGVEKSVLMKAQLSVNDAESYIAGCLAGLGMIQIPAYDVRAYLKTGELVEVMPDYQAAPMPIALLRPYQRQPSLRLKVFKQWLQTLLKEQMH